LKTKYYFCVFLTLFIIASQITHAQSNDKKIIGKVINGQNLDPLPFANIAYANTQIGTTTDELGDFYLPYLENAGKIIVSYVGYKTIILEVDRINIDIENILTLFPIEIFLQEVTVYSSINQKYNLRDANSLSIQSERIREISAGMPDILRSVQALPGIAVNNEFKADFNVRGGNQDENLVLVNGAQVYEPYHIKEASNASVGIFNVDLIKKVDLMTGGFSARYGDKMSSVLNINYREGNKDEYVGAASVSLAYVDGYIEGPISDKSSFIFGVRKSYMEYILSLIDFEDINTAQPAFYDIQGVINYDISPSNKILFEFIHAGDDFSYLPDRKNLKVPIIGSHNGEEAIFKSSKIELENNDASYFSNLFDIKSQNILSSKSLLNFELSYYGQMDNEYRLFDRKEAQEIALVRDNTQFFDSLYTTRFTYDSLKIETIEFKSNLLYQFSPNYDINAGISFQDINYKQNANDLWTYLRSENLNDPETVVKDTLIRQGSYGDEDPIDTKSYKANLYLENIIQINDKFTLNLGGRIDYFDINRDYNISPRINLAYSLANNLVFRAAWGHYYQSPDYGQLHSSIASDTNTTAQKSIHYIAGLESTFYLAHNYDHFIKLKIEGYYKDYSNIISSWYGTFERLTYSRINDAIGNASGLDLYVVLKVPGIYTWLSYGLLYANEDQLDDNIGEYPRYTDQRHSISLVSNFELGANWDLSLKGFYGSGFPYTPKRAVRNSNNEWIWESDKIHSAHLPAYKRVDFRLSKSFIFEKSRLNVFIDISNIFNFKNIQNYEYDTPGYTKPQVEEILLWPIVPSFGIRWQL